MANSISRNGQHFGAVGGLLGARKSFRILINQTAYEENTNKEFRISHGTTNSTSGEERIHTCTSFI
jgi:hypothetical protein